MKNPWVRVPNQPPYALPLDEEPLAERYPYKDPKRAIHLECLPEPFLGRVDAPIVLLGLKPGLAPGDPIVHAGAVFAETARRSLAHDVLEYPLYLLDPRFSTTPGGEFYRGALKDLAAEFGAGPADADHNAWRTIANQVLVVNFFPYHSMETPLDRRPLTSQMYGFHLAQKAIARNALVIVVLGDKWWADAVPELSKAKRPFKARNARSWTLSPGNVPEGFPEAVKIIRDGLG